MTIEINELAVAEQPPSEVTALTVAQRADIALKGVELEAKLLALVKSTEDITEINNAAGRTQVHAAGMVLLKHRTGLIALEDSAVEDAKGFIGATRERRKALLAISTPEEDRLFALRDGWDEKVKAEKAAKLAAEKLRVDTVRAKVDAIRNTPAQWLGKPSQDIGAAADHLSETVIAMTEFFEFTDEGVAERDHAVRRLRDMQSAQAAHEVEQQRLADERAALAKERAEAEERGRVAAEERAAQEKKDRAARLEQERRDREVREQEEADHREALRRAQEEIDAKREEHEARMAAERAEIARQQDEIAASKAEQEKAGRERQEAIEAEARARQEAAEAAARLEADHEEALAENARIDAERAAEMEATRARIAKVQELAEKARREQIQFEKHGPAPEEILSLIAERWDVEQSVAQHWLAIHNWHVATEKAA